MKSMKTVKGGNLCNKIQSIKLLFKILNFFPRTLNGSIKLKPGI